MTGRVLLLLLGALVAAFLLFTAVVRPAVERGGWGELAFVVIVFLAVLFAERWARSR